MNSKAKAILDYLTELSGTGVIAGQFGAYGEGTGYDTAKEQLADIYFMTGRDVALTGMDYAMPKGRNEANRFLIDQWKRNMIVTLSWHAPNPFTAGMTNDITGNNRLLELVDPSANVGKEWMRTLSYIADSLTALREAGVPVLWRPFHEQNGGWFWWTPRDKPDGTRNPAPFVHLWRHMYAYFTQERGLDNLLWVFSPNTCDKWRARVLTYYPGDDVVDIVGLDKYRDLGENPLQLNKYSEYDDLVRTGKPVMLCEFGAIPANGAGWNTEVYDWQTFIRDLRDRYPKIAAFLAWEWVFQIAYEQNVGQAGMMNHPAVVTLDKLPGFDVPLPEPEPPPVPVPGLTEADVRRIVLEEVTAAESRISTALLAKVQAAINKIEL